MDSAADTMLARVKRPIEQTAFTLLPNPAHEAFDVVEFTQADDTVRRYMLDVVSIPLDSAGALTATARGNGGDVMRELAEALKRRAGLRMRQGVVTAIDGSTCSVLIGGSTVAVDGVQHLNSCAPRGRRRRVDHVGRRRPVDHRHARRPAADRPVAAARPSRRTSPTPTLPARRPCRTSPASRCRSGVQLTWDLPPEALWRTWEVYQGVAADFETESPAATVNTCVLTIPHEQGSGPWFYKVRAVNSRGEASTFAGAGPFTVPTTTIPDGSLDIAKFASGIIPPRVVDALPDLPDVAFPPARSCSSRWTAACTAPPPAAPARGRTWSTPPT